LRARGKKERGGRKTPSKIPRKTKEGKHKLFGAPTFTSPGKKRTGKKGRNNERNTEWIPSREREGERTKASILIRAEGGKTGRHPPNIFPGKRERRKTGGKGKGPATRQTRFVREEGFRLQPKGRKAHQPHKGGERAPHWVVVVDPERITPAGLGALKAACFHAKARAKNFPREHMNVCKR